MSTLKEREARKKDNHRFSGKRVEVLERDGYQCVECHMTQDEHLATWNKSLTINHIDGNGRNSVKPNNTITNLETLCLRCHGIKDGPRWMLKNKEN